MKTTTKPTQSEVIEFFKPILKKMGFNSFLVDIKQWAGSSPWITVTAYSNEKNKDNNQSKYSISGDCSYENFEEKCYEIIELKLKADYIQEQIDKK